MTRLSRVRIVDVGSRHERLENVRQHLPIGTRGQRSLLRAAQLSCRDGLHRLGDLPRVDHAADAASDVENVGHEKFSVLSSQFEPPDFRVTGTEIREPHYFATACLESMNCCFASLITLDISALRLSSRTFFSMIVLSRPGFVVSTYLYRSSSNSRT